MRGLMYVWCNLHIDQVWPFLRNLAIGRNSQWRWRLSSSAAGPIQEMLLLPTWAQPDLEINTKKKSLFTRGVRPLADSIQEH